MSLTELMVDIPAEHENNVFGQFDNYAKKIERTFRVTLIARDGAVKVLGEGAAAEKARRVLTQLTELSRRGNSITEQNVDYAISLVFEDQEEALVEIDRDLICYTLQGKPIKPKTLGQKKYVDAVKGGMVTFGLGPAGSGSHSIPGHIISGIGLVNRISLVFWGSSGKNMSTPFSPSNT